MSGLIVGLVMRTRVTEKFNGQAKFVAMVYAEHAWPDGSHAHPAIETVADYIGCSARTVQRHVRTLEEMGMLISSGKGPHGTNQYSFPLVELEDGSARLELKPKKTGGDNLSPRQIDGGDTDSGDTDSGDTGVTQLNNPLLSTSSASSGDGLQKGDAEETGKGAKVQEQPPTPAKSSGTGGSPQIAGNRPKSDGTGDLGGEKTTPNIFGLYEANIGALTPILADALREAEKVYAAPWVEYAFAEAVKNNKRSWAYVETILKRIQIEGFGGQKHDDKLSTAKGKTSGGAQRSQDAGADGAPPSDARRAAADRINARRREKTGAG